MRTSHALLADRMARISHVSPESESFSMSFSFSREKL